MKLLENQTVLITGATRGIGKAIALKLAEHGANIAFSFVADSSKEKAVELQQAIEQQGVQAMYLQFDAANYNQTEQFVNNVIERFGSIDVAVNNAGITRDNLLLRLSESQFEQVINTNLKSVFNVTKQVIKPMMKARKGSIINISSIVGVMGNAGQSNYAASKAGIIGFTKSIALEMGSRNLRCNAIAPGFIETEMTQTLDTQAFLQKIPLARLGLPEDVANAALFLASPLSQYITGQVLSVCGGISM